LDEVREVIAEKEKRIAELEAKLAAIPQKQCAECSSALGKRYWSDVPGRGDLCEACHDRK
jgi:hypothetical protein